MARITDELVAAVAEYLRKQWPEARVTVERPGRSMATVWLAAGDEDGPRGAVFMMRMPGCRGRLRCQLLNYSGDQIGDDYSSVRAAADAVIARVWLAVCAQHGLDGATGEPLLISAPL